MIITTILAGFSIYEGLDRGDLYEPPMIDGHLAVGLSPEADGGYYHTTDIRSISEMNGVGISVLYLKKKRSSRY
ncbi:MAG: hypothetical protein CM1200mP10_33260 [Candidatus Neomarinimicrobiota bacterium]|nr:MAG: hypothetical protein CM1200mP10_33260 [Candidatus Neomarinimicrobiota bacterium]